MLPETLSVLTNSAFGQRPQERPESTICEGALSRPKGNDPVLFAEGIKSRLGKFDSRNASCGFYYCPFLSVGRSMGEFCNTFPPKADMAESLYSTHLLMPLELILMGPQWSASGRSFDFC